MQLTGNLNLKKPDQNEAYNIVNENDNMDILDREIQGLKDGNGIIYDTTHIGNKYYADIQGLILTDGYPFTLRFDADSTGDITINLNNTTDRYAVDYFKNRVNNVKKDLIANFRYNAKTQNFQLLGKGGGGNLTADQALVGRTYTSDLGQGVGTMPNNGAVVITPKTYNQPISKGFHNGQGYVKGDQNLTPDKIVSPYKIFDVQGTATAASLGGRQFSVIDAVVNHNTTTKVPTTFEPKLIIIYIFRFGSTTADLNNVGKLIYHKEGEYQFFYPGQPGGAGTPWDVNPVSSDAFYINYRGETYNTPVKCFLYS